MLVNYHPVMIVGTMTKILVPVMEKLGVLE
jgi:hypothetical protein